MKARIIVLLPFLLLLTVMISCNYSGSHNPSAFNYVLSETETALLQEGDIILRHGYGLVSKMIVKTLDEPMALSHVGLVVIDLKGDLFVVHSVSSRISDYDGMQRQTLESFVADSQPESVAVVRYRPTTRGAEKALEMQNRALQYYHMKVPFDYSFSYMDTTRIFCSELVYRVIKDVFDDEIFDPEDNSGKHSFTKGMLENLKFQNFFDEQRFDIIINHHESKTDN